MSSPTRRAGLVAWLRWFVRGPRWGHRLAFGAAALVVLAMFFTNVDMGHDPDSPRGDGKYRPVLARGDGHMMYLMARSTALDGDWDFANDLGRFGDPWNQQITKAGRKAIPHPIGPPLVWTPLIWIAELGAVVANVFGADIALHAYTPFHQRFVFLSCVLAGILAVALGRNLARRSMGARWSSTYAAIAVLLGTSLTYYVTYMPSYGHAFDACACALFLAHWATTIGRRDRKRWLVLGALLGLAMLIRMQELGMAIVLAVEGVVALARSKTRAKELVAWLVGAAWVVLALAIVFSPQLLYWKVVYGDPFASPQGAKYTRFGSPMILELLYSARNGWFSSTPIAYAGAIGLFCLPRRSRLIAAGFLAAVVVQVYLNSTIMDWWGQAAFGQRRLCSVTLPLVVGTSALLWRCARLARRFRVPRAVGLAFAALVFGALVAWNLMRVGELRAGVPAPAGLDPTCCDRVPAWIRPPLAWIYDRVGNPFELPASALFAIRHDVPLRRWDAAVGNYPLVPPANALFDGTLKDQGAPWKLGHPGSEPYLLTRFSGSRGVGGRPLRWAYSDTARVLVPNLMPEPERITVWVFGSAGKPVTLRWNGDAVATKTLETAGWNTLVFELHPATVGDHELTIEAPLAPLEPAIDPTLTDRLVAVGVGTIEVHLLAQ